MAENTSSINWSIIISAIALIFSLSTTLYSLFIDPKRKYKKELKIEVIKGILPKVLGDIRISIINYKKSKTEPHNDLHVFTYLEKISISGQIESIYFLDQELYTNLKYVDKEIREIIEKYSTMRSDFFKEYKSKWKEYLDEQPRKFNSEHLISQTEIYYPLWAENYEQVKARINKWFRDEVKKSESVEPLTDEELNALIEIFKKVVNTSKALIPEIDSEIDEHIDKKVIPVIELLIRNPV